VRAIRIAALAAVAALACAAQAAAAPVLVLHGKRAVMRHERFLGPTELTPPSVAPPEPSRQRPRQALPKGRSTRDALDALLAQGQIDQASHDDRVASLDNALGAYRSMTGTRRAELGAVIDNADAIAAAGGLTPTRLEPVFQTLDSNAQWWASGPLLTSGQRVSFAGSQLIWQYYPGQGIELQMLGNFAKANALWSSRKRSDLGALLGELVPLATDRGGFLAWEYFFRFGGGAPPWTSAISQGTAVQAFGRAGKLLGDPALTDAATRALGLFEQPPPTGVRSGTPNGAFYLIYTFAPQQLVLNAHLQATIGLYDFAQITGDPRAQALFTAGESEARVAVPRYDTGKWSLYDQTTESDLGYHKLVTTFLTNLCSRTSEPAYCDTATRFTDYLGQAPAVAQATRSVRTGKPARIGFSLDKISRVGMTITDARGRTTLSTSAVVGRGQRYFTWSLPGKPGLYRVRLTATDLAGNRSVPATGSLRVMKAKKRRR
jgi:Spy/CpxP family protein refolding chaperone